MSEVVIVIPVLARPQNAERVLRSIEDATPEPHSVLFVATKGDREEIRELQRLGADYLAIPSNEVGDYAVKVNAGYRLTGEPLIFTGADDLTFHPGWFAAAKAKLTPNIGVVGTNDLGNPRVKQGKHSTHSLFRREYADLGTIDEPRKIYHEGYPHVFCDDEAIETAQARRAFAFAKDSVVEHQHPHWRKGEHDAVYKMAEDSVTPGRVLFRQRRPLWRGRRLPAFHV